MARPSKYKITDDDISFLRDVYPTGNWKAIEDRLPNIPRHKIYHIVNNNNITMDNYFWSERDKDILTEFYYVVPTQIIQPMLDKQYTIRQIQNQALKMGLTKSRFWTDDEIFIMSEKYSELGAVGVANLLPNKSQNAILCKARAMGLVCDFYWKEDEVKFLIDNWPQLSDKEISKELGRSVAGVADKRRSLGLYFPKNDTSYYNIDDFIRHRNYKWKKESMQNCGYKCVITGSSDFEVHHTYSFNLILKEAMLDSEWINKDFADYIIDELNHNLNIFLRHQSKYPLGVCLSTDMHKKFHSIYGNHINTPEQFEEFLNIHISISD